MTVNIKQGVILLLGFLFFLLRPPETEYRLVDMLVLADLVGRIFVSSTSGR
jgi:hypothetical protein